MHCQKHEWRAVQWIVWHDQVELGSPTHHHWRAVIHWKSWLNLLVAFRCDCSCIEGWLKGVSCAVRVVRDPWKFKMDTCTCIRSSRFHCRCHITPAPQSRCVTVRDNPSSLCHCSMYTLYWCNPIVIEANGPKYSWLLHILNKAPIHVLGWYMIYDFE